MIDFKDTLTARRPLYGARGTLTALFRRWALPVACVLIIPGLLGSSNAALWAIGLLSLPVALWLLGRRESHPVLLWVIAVNWLAVIGDILYADLTGNSLSGGWAGPYQVEAMIFSLCAVLALSLGMRWGTQLGSHAFHSSVPVGSGGLYAPQGDISLQRAVLWYFLALPITSILGSISRAVPAITQPLYAMTLLKFVCVYLVAAKAFEIGRGYAWVALVAGLEMVIGLTGFFSNYKDAIIVMLIALAWSQAKMNARKWFFAGVAMVAVIWVSLVWTAVKQEYRAHIAWLPIEQRLDWMAQQFLVNDINYRDAFIKLSRRVGYTKLYARIMAMEAGVSRDDTFYFYAAAVQHVLTPRILFPDKAALSDSKITTALLGFKIDSETSIGVGYIAQAYVDFGFPGMLLPILLIGTMLGIIAKYFMTRSAPLLVRQAFATATLFQAFAFAEDIDKALGGIITSFIAMALALKFGYPLIAPRLAPLQVRRRAMSNNSVRNASI